MVEQAPEKEDEEVASAPVPVAFRFFTPRECARLQGFPDSYQLTSDCQTGVVADANRSFQVPEGAQYAAIGNAVAPPMIEAIGRALLGTLSQ
jgi:site-specific DNA-cytosine methylase